MSILEIVDVEAIGEKSPEELKKFERVAKKVKQENTKKTSVTAIKKRNSLMKRGLLSHSPRELHKQGLCGGCRLPKRYCKCGRPLAMNESTLEKFEIAFKCGMNVEEACGEVGVSTNTYYEFERSHLEWRELRMGWQEEPERAARRKVVDEIPKDIKVAQWYLEKKKRDEFGRDDDSSKGPPSVKINLIGMYSVDDAGKVLPQRQQADVIEVESVPFLTDQTPQPNETNQEDTAE